MIVVTADTGLGSICPGDQWLTPAPDVVTDNNKADQRGKKKRTNLVVFFDPQLFLQERASEGFVQAVELRLGHLHVSP